MYWIIEIVLGTSVFVKEYVPRTLLSNQSNTKKFVLDVSKKPTVPVSRYYSSVLGDFVIF